LLLAIIRIALALAIFVALVTVTLLIVSALVGLRVLLLRGLTIGLALLLSLVHGVQDAKVMFRMLEERFCGYPIATTGGIATELQVLLKQLLGGSADADIGSITVENMVAIKRNPAARMMTDWSTAGSTTATTIAARAMIAATHALHVHTLPSCFPIVGGPVEVSGA
jgi:hypothetical protein